MFTLRNPTRVIPLALNPWHTKPQERYHWPCPPANRNDYPSEMSPPMVDVTITHLADAPASPFAQNSPPFCQSRCEVSLAASHFVVFPVPRTDCIQLSVQLEQGG